MDIKNERKVHLDAIRGSFIGGAAGDALGYAVEFKYIDEIFAEYGEKGITEYELDKVSGKALISDDTQMTLFTANGLLIGDTRGRMRGVRAYPRYYVATAYRDWLVTQHYLFENRNTSECISWLCEVPELYELRAPGNTCIWALKIPDSEDNIKNPKNNSKGCGGVMRIAPVALNYPNTDIEILDMESAHIAAITHGHSLGVMPAATLCHIINRIVFSKGDSTLKEIIIEAKNTTEKLFKGDEHLKELTDLIDLAIALSENDESDLENIKKLGEGWVAEETLAIAIYCSLKYQNDFSKGIIAAVNHNGDSDSTGAVTGNILGALLGYDAIEDKWKENLECKEIILEMADDICYGCQMSEMGSYFDEVWYKKYMR